jgi:hypothetical protein
LAFLQVDVFNFQNIDKTQEVYNINTCGDKSPQARLILI